MKKKMYLKPDAKIYQVKPSQMLCTSTGGTEGYGSGDINWTGSGSGSGGTESYGSGGIDWTGSDNKGGSTEGYGSGSIFGN